MGAPKMESDESNRATGATLGMYFSTFFLSSFLSLMKEKRAKENQAPTGGGEVGRVQERAGVVFLDEGNRATGAPKMESNGSNRAAGATLGVCFPTFSLSSFLSLMKEKRAKENQAPTGGGEVGRVRVGAGVVFLDEGYRATGALQMESDRSNRAAGATLGVCFLTFSLSSFLSLMKEKRAKENQAPTGGGEVGRVRERGWRSVFRWGRMTGNGGQKKAVHGLLAVGGLTL